MCEYDGGGLFLYRDLLVTQIIYISICVAYAVFSSIYSVEKFDAYIKFKYSE